MFQVVSVILFTHDALDLTVQGPPILPSWTSGMGPPLSSEHQTWDPLLPSLPGYQTWDPNPGGPASYT